jgi:hypothetical protein
MLAAERLVGLHRGDLDREAPAARHGVAGVDGQVHQHLLELAGVGPDRRRLRGQHRHQLDVLADEAAQHLGQLGDERSERHDLGDQHLLAAEGEELPREGGGALRGLADLHRLGPQRGDRGAWGA